MEDVALALAQQGLHAGFERLQIPGGDPGLDGAGEAAAVNPDGSTPDFLWCMDDDAAFEKANEECSALIVAAGLESALNAARDNLKAAEDRLIAYGLSLAPAGVRATLEQGVKQNATTRQKVLDATFRLDVSTVPA